MPKTHTHITYSFDELSTRAQDKALEEVAQHLAGAWWDSSDNDAIEEAMLYALADKLQSPGYDACGTADFPGVDGLKVEGWNLDHQEYKLEGVLTRDNAPALPWPEDCDLFRIGNTNRRWNGNSYDLWLTDSSPEWMADADRADVQKFIEAYKEAISAALEAGQTEYDYKTGEKYAREWIEGNDPQFDEDGTLHES